MCLVFRKSACPFGQVKIEMYLPESPFFKNSLSGASGLVLMSVPVVTGRVAYRYSGTDRNRYSFLKEPVFTRFVENRY